MSSSYDEIFDEFTDKQLLCILKDQDYENVRILTTGLIRFTHNSMNYLINNSYDDGSIGIFMVFDDIDISFKEMNEWNAERRFVTIYKDNDGKLCLKMDLESGMTEEYLLKSIKRFIELQMVFSLLRLDGLARLLKVFN